MKTKKRSRKKSHENFFKKNFNLSLEYIRNSRKFIYAIFWIFIAFAILGGLFPVPQVIADRIQEFINNLLSQTEDLSWFGLIKFILFNNVQSSFVGMIFGIILGIFSVVTVVVNGYVVGFVSLLAVKQGGILILWRLFPHGIFELPALFISLGLGLKLGTFIFQKDIRKSFKDYMVNSLRVFVFVVIPLLVIAAIIEGTLIFFVG